MNLLKLKKKKTYKKQKKSSLYISIGTALALAAINYTLMHSPYVLLMTFVLFIHELGHYLVAKKAKADVNYPIFLPIPFIGIAFTKVKNLSEKHKPIVALAGILFSSIFIILLIAFNILNPILSYSILFTFLFAEVFFNYFGIDGSKYRKAKYKTTQNLS